LAVDLTTTPATLRVLVAEAEGVPFLFTDEVETDAAGQVYFTDASSRFGRHDYTNDLIEGRGHGRFMRYDPFTKTTTVLLGDLRFANGVALAADDSYALINETGRYRVWRYWLTGDKAGSAELFIENLPGFPDNIDLSPRGTLWIAQFTLRKRILDVVHPSPALKRLMAALPEAIKPKAQRYGLMLEVDAQGKIVRSLHDPSGDHVPHVTSVNERDGVVYLGNLTSPNLPALVLPAP
jgi:sugar lactone lactonase YvrE